jgi:HTH-type transcriptional regulator/antitoxin HipB
MDQNALAKKAGVSRKWLVEVERGKPSAEIGLVLRTLKSLEVSIDLEADTLAAPPPPGKAKAPDINSVLESLKKPSRKKPQ